LTSAYEFRGKENNELRMQIFNLRLYQEVQTKEFNAQIRSGQNKANRKFRIGLTCGTAVGLLVAILTH
jgi:hypothetical protein